MGIVSAPSARVTPERLLALWREAERELGLATPGTEVHRVLAASVQELGRAYRRTVDARIVAADEDARRAWL